MNIIQRLRQTKFGRLFLDKKFAHYTWTSIAISLLNIFLIWFLIDVIEIPTIIATSVVIGFTFILRYIIFDYFKIF